jgi:hypothetical protein
MLTQAFSNIKADYPTLNISASNDGEAQGFARELKAFFNDLGMHVDRVGFLIAISPESAPLQVAIKDLKKVPPKAERFARAVSEAGFQVTGALFEAIGDDQFVLIISSQR